MGLFFWAGIIFLVIPVTTAMIYATICFQKEKRLKKIFAIILHPISSKSLKGQFADQAIKILHQNKVLIPPSPIVINIKEDRGAILAYYLFRAEICFLLTCLEERRKQRLYLETVTPYERSNVLKILKNTEQFLGNLDIAYLDFLTKIEFASACYQNLVKIYYVLPDKNGYPELNFWPLFIIVDKTPTRELLIFPRWLENWH